MTILQTLLRSVDGHKVKLIQHPTINAQYLPPGSIGRLVALVCESPPTYEVRFDSGQVYSCPADGLEFV